jgi:hypothetical protein
MTTATIDINALRFIKLKIPRLIPKEIIEGVKGRTFTPEQFYEYQEANADNPYNFLFAFVDDNKKIHGFLWAEQNVMDGTLFINTFSIDKQLWGKGKPIPKVIEFLHELKRLTKARIVFWITTNEKFYIKHGFKRSKNCLLEYSDP